MKTQGVVGVKKKQSRKSHSSNNQFQKRREVMKASSIIRMGVAVVVGLVLVAGSTYGQTLRNRGVFRNTGTSTYNNIENYRTGTAGTILNSGSLTVNNTLDNDDGATAQGTIRNYIGGLAAGTLTVTSAFTNEGGSFYNDSTTYVPVLNLGGTITSTGTFDTDAGKVVYTGAGGQTIFGTTYGALVAAGSNTKTLGASLAVNDSLRINSTLAVSTYTLTVNAPTGIYGVGGTLNGGSGTGTVNYAANANQAVYPSTLYNNLTLSGAAVQRNKQAGGAVTVAGTLTVGSNDSLDVTGAFALSGTLQNSGGVKLGGSADLTGATLTTPGTFVYYAAVGQTVAPAAYADLILRDSTGTKTFTAGQTYSVSGSLVLERFGRSGASFGAASIFKYVGTGTQTVAALDYALLEFEQAGQKNVSGWVNSSGVTIASTATPGGVYVAATGTLRVVGGDLTNDGVLTNDGTVTVQ